MSLDIIDIRASSFLRSPYADSRKTRNSPIHASVQNRSGIQRKRLGAPDSRNERTNPAKDARDSSPASYEGLTPLGVVAPPPEHP